ncbi:MAG: hypothetical protein H6843_13930 [Rhodospirillaceae bacterium]|nr:hypothetical protein [Rhodospirillaceae bacterium]
MEGRYQSVNDFLGALIGWAVRRWQDEDDPDWTSPEQRQFHSVVEHYQHRERLLKELLTEAIERNLVAKDANYAATRFLEDERDDALAALRRARTGKCGNPEDSIPF